MWNLLLAGEHLAPALLLRLGSGADWDNAGRSHRPPLPKRDPQLNEPERTQHQLLQILAERRGPERRIRRGELLAALQSRVGDISDREMRSALEQLRWRQPQGAWICAHLRGGYFMARDEAELERYLRSDENRANNLLRRVRTQRRAAGLQRSKQIGLWTGS